MVSPSAAASSTTYVREGGPDRAEALLRTEWLLTNALGGFAMGTALGAATRRYHGLLIAPLRPPVQRVMALSNIADSLILEPGKPGEERFDLSVFKFRPGVLHPRGDALLEKFEKDVSVRWTYRAGGAAVVREIHLARESSAVALRYTIQTGAKAARLFVRPLIALRDFHALILRDTSPDRFRVVPGSQSCVVHGPMASLHLTGVGPGERSTAFVREEQWWNDFQYDQERDRGYDYLEDLFNPGHFVVDIAPGQSRAVFTLHASLNGAAPFNIDADADQRRARLVQLGESTTHDLGGKTPSASLRALINASDDFIVRRVAPPKGPLAGTPDRATIIAGYPWFADWGRDSMISLPGLLLTTRRLEEARQVLLTFATNRAGGLIPNVFDDYSGEAHYNTMDASLWFVHAACGYLKASGDAITFRNDLLPACLDIIEHYRKGTSFGIHMDKDGLIAAGDASTQLTWMDAKRDGVAFTPRFGKAVEINALWYNALASLVEHATGLANASELSVLKDRVGLSLRTQFWNAELGCLIDSIQPLEGGQWSPQREVRPNQIFAVSLPHSALEPLQQKSVVDYVKARLLTPLGVRTLDPADSRYKGRYRGTMFARDSAYHNGTAWPWLLGPMAEAILRVGKFSRQSIEEARAVLAPIIAFLNTECPGQLPEVFDGDDTSDQPQRSGGCPAQAWSVAEPLRVLAMIEKGSA